MACPIATIENLAQCQGWSVGIGETLKIGLPADFTVTPLPPVLTNSITNEAYATAVGTFTPVTDKGFISVELDPTSEPNLKVDVDANGAVATMFKGRIAISKDALGFCKKLAPRTKVLLCLDKPHGERLLIGYKGFEATITKWALDESKKNSFADFEIMAFVHPLVYTGAAVPVQD